MSREKAIDKPGYLDANMAGCIIVLPLNEGTLGVSLTAACKAISLIEKETDST